MFDYSLKKTTSFLFLFMLPSCNNLACKPYLIEPVKQIFFSVKLRLFFYISVLTKVVSAQNNGLI